MSTVSYNGNEYTEDQFREAATTLEQQRNVQVQHRDDFLRELGQQYGGDRDIYDVLGYPDDEITSTQYRAKFERQDIARRIVELPAKDTWQEPPKVSDDIDSENPTEFDQSLEQLQNRLRIWNKLSRVDVVSGIGEYGVLFMGMADGQPLDEAVGSVEGPEDLKYLMPFSQDRVMEWKLGKHKGLDNDHPRYNKPVEYTLTFAGPDEDVTDEEHWEVVHWERCIHVAEGKIASEIKGTPRLQPVYNRLQDLEKVLGASAEMFWTGADQKYHFNIDTDDTQRIDSDALDDLDEEVKKLVHDMDKAIKTFNTDLEVIGGQEVNPEGVVDQLLKFISGATGIPKRILTGSERGELASSQDKANWVGKVESRQQRFAGPEIARPFIKRLQKHGFLPAAEFDIEWPSLFELTEQEEAEVWRKRADAVGTLTKGKVFSSAEDLFEFMKEGNTPDFEETEPMQPIPKDTMQEQFERGQQQGGQEGEQQGQQETTGQSQPPAGNAPQFGSWLLTLADNDRSRNLLKELLNRIKGRNVQKQITANFDAIKHPRNPRTGQFVERPYSVPEEIAGLDTEDIVRELARDIPDFEDKMENATIDMDADMKELIKEESSNVAVDDSSILSGPNDAPAKLETGEPKILLMDQADTSDVEGVSYEDMPSDTRDRINQYLNGVVPGTVKHEEDHEKAVSYNTIKDQVDRAGNGNGQLHLRDDAPPRVMSHEFGHQYMETFGFTSSRGASDRSTNHAYKKQAVMPSDVGRFTFSSQKPIKTVESRDEINEGDTLSFDSGHGTAKSEVIDIEDNGTVWLDGGMIMPDEDISNYSKEVEIPDRVQELADATDDAFVEANSTYYDGRLEQGAQKVGGASYALSNSHETFAMMHESMQFPSVSSADPGLVAKNQPDWVRAYAKNFKISRGAKEAIQQANYDLFLELEGGEA